MRMLRLAVVCLLALGFTPGAGELVSDAAHLVLEGHTAHSADHDDHGSHGAEHGCTGWHHTCPCHTSVSFVVVSSPGVPVAASSVLPSRFEAHDRGPEGVERTLERPPRA